MPFFGRQGILAKTATAAAALDAGFFQNEFFHTNANKAAHPVIDKGSGQNWNGAGSGTFSLMFWFKASASDIDSTYENALVFRTLGGTNGNDNGQFAEITSAGIVTGTQQNNSTFRLIIWQPASFSTNYIDGNWHHIAIQLKPGASKIFADGVDKSSEATLPSGSAAAPDQTARYLFVAALPFAHNSATYGGIRASKVKFADFWYKNADDGALDFANDKGYVYSSTGNPWIDLGASGNASGNIPTPDIFLRIDGGALVQDGATGTYTLTKGTGSANQIESSTGGPQG
jgi:hypothetical protein